MSLYEVDKNREKVIANKECLLKFMKDKNPKQIIIIGTNIDYRVVNKLNCEDTWEYFLEKLNEYLELENIENKQHIYGFTYYFYNGKESTYGLSYDKEQKSFVFKHC